MSSASGGRTSSAGTGRLRVELSSGRSGITSTPSSTIAAYDDLLLPTAPLPNLFSRFNFRKLRSRICGGRKKPIDIKKGSIGSAHPEQRLKEIKVSVLKEWENSFSALLTHPDGLELFEGFLMSEFSEENIQFWKACERYKTIPDNMVVKEATQVYEEYIAPEAPRLVNIDYETKREILENMRIPNRSSFCGAQQSIYMLMNLDGYVRFIKSEGFQEALNRKNHIERSKSMWA